jgi:hypothetical protein
MIYTFNIIHIRYLLVYLKLITPMYLITDINCSILWKEISRIFRKFYFACISFPVYVKLLLQWTLTLTINLTLDPFVVISASSMVTKWKVMGHVRWLLQYLTSGVRQSRFYPNTHIYIYIYIMVQLLVIFRFFIQELWERKSLQIVYECWWRAYHALLAQLFIYLCNWQHGGTHLNHSDFFLETLNTNILIGYQVITWL